MNTEPFTPAKKEIRITIEVSAREAHLLKELRKISFGKITVYKANNILVRIEPNESVLLNDNEGLDLKEDIDNGTERK